MAEIAKDSIHGTNSTAEELSRLAVGDVVRIKVTYSTNTSHEYVGTVLAFNEKKVCLSEAPGLWDSYWREDVKQIIKRTNAPQPPRLYRIEAQADFVVRAQDPSEALEMVYADPTKYLRFILAEPEDVREYS